jgi:hypothetical protein
LFCRHRLVPACFTSGYDLLYEIQAGDTLNAIIQDHYGAIDDEILMEITSQIKENNPDITDIDLIFPGQIVYLEVPFRKTMREDPFRAPTIQTVKEELKSLNPHERKVRESLIHSKKFYFDIGKNGLSFSQSAASSLQTSIRNIDGILKELTSNYVDYVNSKITKHYYTQNRLSLISKVKQRSFFKPGSFNLNGAQGRNARKILAMSPKTKDIGLFAREASSVNKMVKVAAKAGVVLQLVELGSTGYQICHSRGQREKNDLLIGQIGSISGGAGAGIMAAFFLGSNPVGWAVIIAVGAASMLSSIALERGAVQLYNHVGGSNKYDIVDTLKIESLCGN